MRNLSLKKLREVNAARALAWNGDTPWSPADRMTELIGELGEAANVMKKLRRIECGMAGNDRSQEPALREQLKTELADTLICVDLLANELNIDLSEATIEKFNRTSEKVGLPHRLESDC